jgi:Family of unknown function (DUF5677)
MAIDLKTVLDDARQKREFSYSIFIGTHQGEFHRKEKIALSLYARCLQAHEAIEILVSRSLVDDAWILMRALVEHAINSAYMLLVADAQTADNFAEYSDYTDYEYLQAIKGTDEQAFRHQVSEEQEEKARQRFEKVRGRFKDKRGNDKWCPDGPLWKRADCVDKFIRERTSDETNAFLWLANTAWRMGSAYTHGAASALVDQLRQAGKEITIQRIYTQDEGAKVLHWANFALYIISIPIDIALGGKNVAEINRRNVEWAKTFLNDK